MERQPESIKASLSPEQQAKIFKPSAAERAKPVEVDNSPKVGDVLLVKRSNGKIEEATVRLNEKGEKVLSVIMADGRPGDKLLNPQWTSVEGQHKLAEARQQAEVDGARAQVQKAIAEMDGDVAQAVETPVVPYGEGAFITNTDGSDPDAMKFYSKSPSQLMQPPITSIPATSPNAPIPKHEPSVDDNPARRITIIDPQGANPSEGQR